MTGVGFWTQLLVSPGVPRAPVAGPRLALGGVGATLEGVEHGVGFVLFVEDGQLDFLEGFTFDEPWPQRVDRFAVSTPVDAAAANNLEQADRAFQSSAEPPPGDTH